MHDEMKLKNLGKKEAKNMGFVEYLATGILHFFQNMGFAGLFSTLNGAYTQENSLIYICFKVY